MPECEFCDIARGTAEAAVLFQDDRFIAFADIRPIRSGHVQIIPRDHFETFETLPADLAAGIVHLGQRIALAMKAQYGVERVGFVFTGNEVAHVHAHVLPLHEATDITSLRFFDAKLIRPGTLPSWTLEDRVSEMASLRTALIAA